MCKACESSFTAKTPIVEEQCYISNYVKANVLSQFSGVRSVKDISEETHVSQSTVQRSLIKRLKTINHFTMRYSLIYRKQIKTVVVDMNTSYVNIVQLVNRSMNKTRVHIMNQFN